MAGIRFFEMSWSDINRPNVTAEITNNNEQVSFFFNRDTLFNWRSAESNDQDEITLTVDFNQNRLVDSVFILRNNLKRFTLEYLNGSVWSEVFTEADNTEPDYFRKINPIVTGGIRLKMSETIHPDAQKTVRDLFLTQEIGQFVGYPRAEFSPDPGLVEKEMLGGRYKLVQEGGSRRLRVQLRDHVGSADRALFSQLFNRKSPFLVWPSAGEDEQFGFADDGWRRQDVMLMMNRSGYQHSFTRDLYKSGMNAALDLIEVA